MAGRSHRNDEADARKGAQMGQDGNCPIQGDTGHMEEQLNTVLTGAGRGRDCGCPCSSWLADEGDDDESL